MRDGPVDTGTLEPRPRRSASLGAGPDGTGLAVFASDGSVVMQNPADRALFGHGGSGAALRSRFELVEEADALMGVLCETGSAEADLVCRTRAGPKLLRVSGMPSDDQGGGIVLSFAEPPKPAAEAEALTIPAGQLARLGHELRSPLNAVLGFADMIRHGQSAASGGVAPRMAPSLTAEYATDIVTAAWRLLRLADDLVALGESRSATPVLRLGEVDLGRILRRLIRLARPAAVAAQVRLDEARMPGRGDGPLVLGDEGALWSAVDNLVQNAIRHAGEDGHVRIGLLDPGAEGGVLIEVADDGEGMTQEDLAIALSPFGRPGQGQGPQRAGGLGLPIARELIEAHDGQLLIDTAPGRGFAARIRFPASRCLPF